MVWGSALSVLVGVGGGVLLVCAVVFARKLGARRSVGTSGAGLLASGLALSGVVDVLARTLLTFNPLRWGGLAAAGVGFLMLSWSGLVRRRGVDRTAVNRTGVDHSGVDHSGVDPSAEPEPRRAVRSREQRRPGTPAVGDPELKEIEEILRRRGIS